MESAEAIRIVGCCCIQNDSRKHRNLLASVPQLTIQSNTFNKLRTIQRVNESRNDLKYWKEKILIVKAMKKHED